MKCYTMKSKKGEYIKFQTYISFISTTDKPEDARHYKTYGSAKGVLSRELTAIKDSIEFYQSQITASLNCNNTNNKSTGWYNSQVTTYIAKQKLLEEFTVVELDVETPFFVGQDTKAKKEFKFNESDEIGVTTKISQGNMYCKGCGIYFKQIPFMQFGLWDKPARICPLCIIERAKDAETLLKDMDEERRTEFETERFAHRLG